MTEAEEHGEFIADIVDSNFGENNERVDLDLESPVILMGLPRMAGWKPFGHMKLSHQLYTEIVEEWIEENGRPREIAAVNPNKGKWQTVWARDDHDPCAEERNEITTPPPELPETCPHCGEEIEGQNDTSVRWNGQQWEHKSSEVTAQAGHHIIRKEDVEEMEDEEE